MNQTHDLIFRPLATLKDQGQQLFCSRCGDTLLIPNGWSRARAETYWRRHGSATCGGSA
jgi:hypothetical protein